jgi:hypothetical protein
MHPWSIDARETIKETSDIAEEAIEKTPGIKKFLYDNQFMLVVATKGFGKSLILLLKRATVDKSHFLVPMGVLLDVPMIDVEHLRKSEVDLLSQEQTMKAIWSMSIMLAVIKRLGKENEVLNAPITDSLKSIIQFEQCTTVANHFSYIVSDVGHASLYKELLRDMGKILYPILQSGMEPVAIFIDNVDECFSGSDKELWYIAQTSLVKAIYEITRMNSKIKVYASIRKEALAKLEASADMYTQITDICLDLLYDKDELRDIFIKNIQQ